MKLSRLIDGVQCAIKGSAETEISGIAYNSINVKNGFLFVALPGARTDGRMFIKDAISRGASAVLTDDAGENSVPVLITTPDPRLALSKLSANYYQHPDRRLNVLGITGTNGKTTISYLLESMLNANAMPSGVIGTINYRYANKLFPAPNTTPQAADIFRILQGMLREKIKAAIMEVSSHALALGRVADVEFDRAIFTNLTRDHLDFHQTMEDYFLAKTKLFSSLAGGIKKNGKFAIINADDPWAKKLIEHSKGAETITYGIDKKADVHAENIRVCSRSTEFILNTPSGHRKVHFSHLGRHNIYNALAVAATAFTFNLSPEAIAEGLEKAPHVPGRLERVDAGQPFTVLVDYAHTDDALVNVLTALRGLSPERIITVFGCGGDRDRSKRPLMGEAATSLSDFVIVTSDNPRSEEPDKIALDIEVGIRRHHRDNYRVILDREQAIATAIQMAHKGDIVLLAGKGHETYQIIGNQTIHFNDTETARKYIADVMHFR